jgi:hypothetical protein
MNQRDERDRVVPNRSEEEVALIRFNLGYAHTFGPPNAEGFAGHPLAARGLRPHRAGRIEALHGFAS